MASFPAVIPDDEKVALDTRRFADYAAPHLNPPAPVPPPEPGPAAPPMPGGFDPGAPPPPENPEEQAMRFAAYVQPHLDDNSGQTSQGAPGGLATPEMAPGGSPGLPPPPAPFQPAFDAAGADRPPSEFEPSGVVGLPWSGGGVAQRQSAGVGPLQTPEVVGSNPAPAAASDDAQRFWDYTQRALGPQVSQPVGPQDVGPPTIADNLPRTGTAALKAIGEGVNNRIEQANQEYADWQAATQAMDEKLRRGEQPTEEEWRRALDPGLDYAMSVGGEAPRGPKAGQFVPDPSDFAAWMRYKKDLAAGQPQQAVRRSPMGMQAYERYLRENPDFHPPEYEMGPVAQPPAGGVLEQQRGMPMSGEDAIARTDKMYGEGATRARQPLAQRWENFTAGVNRDWIDQGRDLVDLEKVAANNLGRSLKADEMASVQSRLNPFYTARVRVDEQLRPALNDLSDRDYADVRNILTWKGNVDVAAAKANPGRVFSGDLSAADSQAALDALAQRLGPERFGELERRAMSVVDFNTDELARDVRNGLVSQQQADAWMQQYPNYTPVVISDYLKEQGRALGGKSLNVGPSGYKRLSEEGTARLRLDPVAATVDAAYQGEALRRQNTAWRAFHDLIQADPQMQQMFQVEKGGPKGGTRFESSVSGWIDGEQYTITTPFPDLAKAIRQEAGGVPMWGWNTAMQLYKELITARNPTFLVGNAAIDAPLAILNTAMREGGAHKVLPVAVDLFKAYADAFKGIASGQYLGQRTAGYLREGGGMGFYGAPSVASGAEEVARLRRGSVLEVNNAGDLARVAKDLATLNWVKGLGERVELGPRAMAYDRAMKRGLSPEQAVLEGRTVTVDFNQGGKAAKIVNSFVPFFNPALQGSVQGARIIGQNPRGALLTLGPALVGPALAAEAWNRADPERSKAYDDVPRYIKDRGVVVMLPGAAPTDEKGETRPQFVAINLRQLAPIAMLTREVYDRVAGRDGRTAADLLGGAAGQVSPVQGFSTLLPPGVTTGAELAANRDFYRRADIATTRNDERASALAGVAAQGINAASGQRVRPSQADYAIRDLTGGVGEMVSGASDLAAGRTKPSNAPQDVPVVGGFVRRFVRGDVGQELQDARANKISPEVRGLLDQAGIAYDPAPAPGEVNKIPLHRQEHTLFQQQVNKYTDEYLGDLLRSDTFKDLPVSRQKAQIQRQVDRARREAKADVLDTLSDDEIVRRRLEAKEAQQRADQRR